MNLEEMRQVAAVLEELEGLGYIDIEWAYEDKCIVARVDIDEFVLKIGAGSPQGHWVASANVYRDFEPEVMVLLAMTKGDSASEAVSKLLSRLERLFVFKKEADDAHT